MLKKSIQGLAQGPFGMGLGTVAQVASQRGAIAHCHEHRDEPADFQNPFIHRRSV